MLEEEERRSAEEGKALGDRENAKRLAPGPPKDSPIPSTSYAIGRSQPPPPQPALEQDSVARDFADVDI